MKTSSRLTLPAVLFIALLASTPALPQSAQSSTRADTPSEAEQDSASADAWEDFAYPRIHFHNKTASSKGSQIYLTLIPDPVAYIQQHAREVARILYASPSDPMPEMKDIHYSLEDSGPLSAKSGAAPTVSIMYNTNHIESAAETSLQHLDAETRGVLFHELTHAYQHEPKGCGDYGSNKTFWACIEGLADAVRFESGYYQGELYPSPSEAGHWEDGYRKTAAYLIWLKTKRADAIIVFHRSVRDLEVWSFDAAMKYMLGEDVSIEALWEEYVTFLSTELVKAKKKAQADQTSTGRCKREGVRVLGGESVAEDERLVSLIPPSIASPASVIAKLLSLLDLGFECGVLSKERTQSIGTLASLIEIIKEEVAEEDFIESLSGFNVSLERGICSNGDSEDDSFIIPLTQLKASVSHPRILPIRVQDQKRDKEEKRTARSPHPSERVGIVHKAQPQRQPPQREERKNEMKSQPPIARQLIARQLVHTQRLPL